MSTHLMQLSLLSSRPLFRGLRKAAMPWLLALVPVVACATTVRMDTALGPIDIELYDTQAPQTVSNFLNYVRRGDYERSFFHRLIPGFVLQGGGFRLPLVGGAVKIPTDPPVVNEFSATRSNLRGTVAMAKLGGNPNSATNQWFVNLADNAGNCTSPQDNGLNCQNGGFTVFGRLTAPSLAIASAIAALPIISVPGDATFSDLPVLVRRANNALQAGDLVLTTGVRELPVGALVPAYLRVFNYIEAVYPQYATPASPAVLDGEGYTYRFYSRTNNYLGLRNSDQQLCYLVPVLSPNIECFGSLSDWLAMAQAAGY